jgi:hypothetical protein
MRHAGDDNTKKGIRMSIRLPFTPSRAAQATVAVLAATGATGTYALQQFAGILPASWAGAISSVLAVIAGIAGFIKEAEPVIADLGPTTPAAPVS